MSLRDQQTRSTDPAYAQDVRTEPPATAAPAETRTPRSWRARAAFGGATSGLTAMITRLIEVAATAVAAVLALEIVFRIVSAHHGNAIVNRIGIWSHWLATPFVGMFSLHSAKWTLVLNYGVALVVYLIVAQLVVAVVLAVTLPARRQARYGTPVVH